MVSDPTLVERITEVIETGIYHHDQNIEEVASDVIGLVMTELEDDYSSSSD